MRNGFLIFLVGASLLIIFGLGGCAGLASTIEALGKDQTNVCGAVTTVYGSAVAIRANTSGVECSASGSTCTCRQVNPR